MCVIVNLKLFMKKSLSSVQQNQLQVVIIFIKMFLLFLRFLVLVRNSIFTPVLIFSNICWYKYKIILTISMLFIQLLDSRFLIFPNYSIMVIYYSGILWWRKYLKLIFFFYTYFRDKMIIFEKCLCFNSIKYK